MRKFCFICGKKTDDLVEGRCKKCYYKDLTLIKVPKKIEITQCTKCNAFRVKDRWKKISLDNMILDKIKVLEKNVQIEINKGPTFYEIIATNHKTEKHKVRVTIKKVVCPICARQHTQYYEAVLQIRGNYDDKILDFITDRFIMIHKKNKKAFISFHEAKGGVDIRCGSKAAAFNVSEMLKKKYDIRITKSYKLIGKKKGTEIHRNFISVRFN